MVPTVASGETGDTFPGTLEAVQRSAGHSGDGASGYTGSCGPLPALPRAKL